MVELEDEAVTRVVDVCRTSQRSDRANFEACQDRAGCRLKFCLTNQATEVNPRVSALRRERESRVGTRKRWSEWQVAFASAGDAEARMAQGVSLSEWAPRRYADVWIAVVSKHRRNAERALY